MNNVTAVLLITALGAGVAFGQNAQVLIPAPLTKLEAFAARKDVVITTETYFAGSIAGENGCTVRLQAIILYDAAREANKVLGLRVEIREGQQKDEHDAVAFVDFDELQSLSRAIPVLLDLNQKGASLANPVAKELSFSTVGGLTFTMVQRTTDRQLVVAHNLTPERTCTLSRAGAIDELRLAIDKVVQSFQ
jgi:hypothetical protein